MSNKVRTRFAPSPTGYLHVGGLRTALFSYLLAKHNGGDFILRIEDTDQARFVNGAIEKLIHILKEMGLNYDEGLAIEGDRLVDNGPHGPYLQSRRKEIYKKHADLLIEQKKAYMCFCDEKRLDELRKEQEALKQPTRYDRKCRNLNSEEIQANLDNGMPYVVRQAVPLEGQTILKDLVYKDIVWDNKTLDDQILLKSDGFPTYHLAVVVDDHLMEISHVVRGEEWLPSVAKHILLYHAFGWDVPHFAHLPLLLNKDRSKLSKRQGDVSVEDYLAKGYFKEALINFVALLGWNPKTDQEIFSLSELVKQFDLAKVNKAGAIFDTDKLDWLNSQYIKKMSGDELLDAGMSYLEKSDLVHSVDGQYVAKNGKNVSRDFVSKIMDLEKDRIKKLSEIGDSIQFFFTQPSYDPQILIWRKSSLENTKQNLRNLLDFMQNMNDSDFKTEQSVELKIKEFIQQNNLDNGSVLWPLRVALSGLEASPGPFQITAILFAGFGKYEILQRIETALKLLQ